MTEMRRVVVERRNVDNLARVVACTAIDNAGQQPLAEFVAKMYPETMVRAVIFTAPGTPEMSFRTIVCADMDPGSVETSEMLKFVGHSYSKTYRDLSRAGYENPGRLDYEEWSEGIEKELLKNMTHRKERVVGYFVLSGRGEFIP